MPPRAPQPPNDPPPPQELSPREVEIVRYIAEGKASKEIAAQLFISPKTVESHRTNLFRKCGFRSVADVVRYAIRYGLIEA
jgi:DNA-binding NarL/FixJ family response regulator